MTLQKVLILLLGNYLPRIDALWSSNLFSVRSSEVSVVFTPTALHTLLRPSESSSQL